VFSRFGEKAGDILQSVFEQSYSDLRLFILDNACPGFDYAHLVEIIRQYSTEKKVDIKIQKNNHQEKAEKVFKQCVEVAKDCNFTILCPNEIFISLDAISQACTKLQKESFFYISSGNETIPFFANITDISIQLDSTIISIRRALNLARGITPLLTEANWIKHEEVYLNYSSYRMLEKLVASIPSLWKRKDYFYIFERNIRNKLINEFAYPIGLWGLSKNDYTLILYLQQLLEIIQEMNLKNRKSYILLKENLGIFLKQLKTFSESKIKIVFFAQEYSVWPSLQSFYDACKNDERFIAQLVYVPFNHPNSNEDPYIEGEAIPNSRMEPYWQNGYQIIPCTMYDLSKECPDIAVFVKPYDLVPPNFSFQAINKVIRRCIYIGYGFEIAAWNKDYHFNLPIHLVSWKFILYGDTIKELAEKYSYNNGKNIVAWGHPRADYYIDLEKKREPISLEWKNKINNRKVILWNTQHTIKEGIGAGTFLKWREEVFSYFNNHNDIVLLWRPHPFMFSSLRNSDSMTEIEVNNLVETIENRENIILDRSPDYRNSFYASDAIITDGTSFLIEYLYTGKPIIYTPKEGNGDIYFQDEIFDSMYIARDEGDIIQLLDNICQGLDPFKKKRISFAKRMLKVNPEGNGEYIKNQVYSDFTKECSNGI